MKNNNKGLIRTDIGKKISVFWFCLNKYPNARVLENNCQYTKNILLFD